MSSLGKVVIAGGTGFIGSALIRELHSRGYEPVVLTRGPGELRGNTQIVHWDAESPGEAIRYLEGAVALVNLCGSPISVRWTPENRKLILDSRVVPTQVLSEALAQCDQPPKVWVNGSAVGFYGDTGIREVSEASKKGSGFLAETCAQWEAAMDGVALPTVRKVRLRTGIVLGRSGGLFPELAGLAKSFVGGSLGSGEQFISWIHLRDLIRMFVFAIEDERIAGPLNGTAPKPASNAFFMKALRKALHRPWAPPVPKALAMLAARLKGMEHSLLFEGQRVVPQIALGMGFRFRFPTLDQALADLV